MRLVMTAVALATLAAFPAYAAKHTSHTMSSEAQGNYAMSPEAQNAYAMQDPDTVIVNGEVVGRDPDPTVRLNLRRDPGLEAD
jgi:hypothetical protein